MTVKDSQTLGLGYLQLSRYSDSVQNKPSGDRILVWARFSIPVQTYTVPHPASCTMSTGSLFRVIKRPVRGFDHPPSSTAVVKERVKLYFYSPSKPSWPVVG